ncbi:MAG: HpcH/HpaI aldolase/citrate lyase family protein, partial [Alphaproteobacteria bacterium]
NNYLPPFEYCQTMTLLSAVAGEVQPIDAVYIDFNDLEGLKAECNLAASIGFTGKLTIHPAQIDIVNEAFSPSVAEIDEAKRLIEAFEAAQAEGLMAFSFEGKMVDAPHLNRAKKILSQLRKK